MSWPKQFIEVWGVQMPTEEFVKNREAILARMSQQEVKPEAGQMMRNDRKFEEILEEVKNTENWEEEKEVETPVPFVAVDTESDTESDDLTQVPLDEEKEPEKQEIVKPKKKTSWKKK